MSSVSSPGTTCASWSSSRRASPCPRGPAASSPSRVARVRLLRMAGRELEVDGETAGGAGAWLRTRARVLGQDVAEGGTGAEALLLRLPCPVEGVEDVATLAETGKGTGIEIGTTDVRRRPGGTRRHRAARAAGSDGERRGRGVRRGGVAGMIEPCLPSVLMCSPSQLRFLLSRWCCSIFPSPSLPPLHPKSRPYVSHQVSSQISGSADL